MLGLRGVPDGRLAHGERLEHGRVGLLVGPGHDADLADHARIVDLARRPVLAGPVGHRPAPDALLVREGDLVVLAVVLEGLLGPGFLDDLDRFLVDLAVVVVDGGPVHGRPRHVILLAQDIDPAVLVAAGEARVDSPPGQVVEDGQLLGGPDGIPRGQDQAQRGELDALGPGGQVRVEQERGHRRLVALGVEVVLRGREDVEPGIVGKHGELAQLVEHLLVPLVVPPDGPEPLAIVQGAGNGGQHEEHELHRIASSGVRRVPAIGSETGAMLVRSALASRSGGGRVHRACAARASRRGTSWSS